MTRREMTEAGDDMAIQAVEIIQSKRVGAETIEFMDQAIDLMVEASEKQAVRYLEHGIPPKWVMEFRRAFLRTMKSEFEALARANAE